MLEFLIDKQFSQVRIDRWFKKQFLGTPQSLVEKLLRSKDLIVNGEKVKSSYRLQENDKILVNYAVEVNDRSNRPNVNFSEQDFLEIKKNIIFECSDYIVINKPKGFAVQGGDGVKKSIIDIIKFHEPKIDYKIVHRLDKDTTGILIMAKNYFAARYFTNLFANSSIQKTYLAIVDGEPSKLKGKMVNKLLKVHNCVLVDEKGKEAITSYEVLTSYNGQSLIKLVPLTGRMHQLRVQLAHIKCPIVGDVRYNYLDRNLGNNTLCLHAQKIEFVDLNEKSVILMASLPKHFSDFLKHSGISECNI
jgi:23S rRNA pseudouridine955/2504/2580 synthase